MTTRRKIFLSVLAAVFVFLVFLYFNAGPRPPKFQYGVTFSVPYAENLGLNWREVYVKMFEDLKIKNVRISAYWNRVERQRGKLEFEETDFQVSQAEKAGASVVLALGNRLPRWPECHTPDWAKKISSAELENAQLSYMEAVVLRYRLSPAIHMWQVENEPFLGTFGECPPLNKDFLDREIALVKKLDPQRPVLVTDSGELSLWLYSGARGDAFGTTLYRYVFSDVLKRYWTNFIPAFTYRLKAGLIRLRSPGKKIVLAELEAEPWTTKGITQTSIDEQFKTMSLDKFRSILAFARSTGFEEQYLWGVEWWYWMQKNGHPEFLEAARSEIETHQ